MVQMLGKIHSLCTTLSKILADMGVTEIPRMSLVEDALLILGMAVSFACL